MALPQITNFDYNDLITFSTNFSDKIGEGGFAQVYRGLIPDQNRYALPSQHIAIKRTRLTVPSKKISQEKQFMNEKDWLSTLSHPNIIKLIGYSFSDETKCLVLEFAYKGTLTSCIQDLDWRSTLDILSKLGSSIEYIHSRPGGYMHGDLKTNNVLITRDNEPKLSDFGSFMCEGEDTTKDIYTCGYVDPERDKRPDKGKNQSDDVYAFSIIILQLIMKVDDPTGPDDHIAVVARELFKEKGTLVHAMLLNTGCSKSDAREISNLALQLTEVTPPEDMTHTNILFKAMADAGARLRLHPSGIDDTEEAGPLRAVSDIIIEESSVESSTHVSEGARKYIQRPKVADVLSTLKKLKVKENKFSKVLSKRLCWSPKV